MILEIYMCQTTMTKEKKETVIKTLQTTEVKGQELESLLMQQQEFITEEQRYHTVFTDGLTQLQQDIPVAEHETVPVENLSNKQRKKRYKNLQKEMMERPRLISAKEMRAIPMMANQKSREKWASETTAHSNLTQIETLRQVKEGDYSNFENLDPVMRNMMATKAVYDLVERYQLRGNEDPEMLCELIKQEGTGASALLNPTLRLGLSLAQRDSENNFFTKEQRSLFLKLDEAMSTAVMYATLTHVPNVEKVEQDIRSKHPNMNAEQVSEEAHKAIEANKAQQIQIAKRLLLMQLSDFKVISDSKETGSNQSSEKAWDKSVSVALSHCSRVVLTFPKQEKTAINQKEETNKNSAAKHAKMWEYIFTTKGSTNNERINQAQDNKRGSSTHNIERRKVGDKYTKERKVKFNLSGQRGMNCAIGGLGNEGVNGKILSNDGSCGHFYSMYKEGDLEHYGAMLMGLESDCYGVTNQLGHTHDLLATGEQASSLGAQRLDEVGKKYGGRQCDLSGLSAQEIAEWMNKLETKLRSLQASSDGLAGEEAAHIIKALTGKKMKKKTQDAADNEVNLETFDWMLGLRKVR